MKTPSAATPSSVLYTAFNPAQPPTRGVPEEPPAPPRSDRLIALFRSASGLGGATVFIIGVGSLARFALRPLGNHDGFPIGSGLGGASASGFIASGLALLLLRGSVPSFRRTVAIRVLAAFVGLIGIARLVGNGWLAIDQTLDDLVIGGTGIPSAYRIPPNAALNFVLVGTALWLLSSPRIRRQGVAQLFVIASALVSLLALVGYCYRLAEVSGVARLIPMDLASAITFAVLSLSILMARPDRGLMAVVTGPGPGGTIFRRLLVTALLLPFALGWLRLMGERMGYFGLATGVALLVVADIALLVVLLWINSASIDRMEGLRRAAHEKLRESEAFYHSLVESLPQNILRKDREGRFTFGNRRFCETVGRPFEQILGLTDFDMFPPSLAEKYCADDRRVMEREETFESVEEHVTPDGETHYVQVVKAPLRDARGAVVGLQVIFYDVTERWQYEAKLREQNEQLLALAESERRAYDDLKQAQSRMVETAKLAGLGEMVAGVAHEINNPLAFVGNNIAVLQRDLSEIRELIALYHDCDGAIESADPERLVRIREFRESADMEYTLENSEGLLTRTREGVRRIQRIVGDLRLFARLDEGDRNLVDLNEGVESTVNIVMGNAKKKSVEVVLDLDPLPKISCYGTKLNQVIMNLVSNAIDACDHGGRVVVRTRAAAAGVLLEVEDDGAGIEPSVRDQIFNPFFTTKPIGIGTGLGLSISYGIVQDHGGTIEVDSEPGRGARFSVHLPSCLPDLAAHEAEHPAAMAAADPSSPRSVGRSGR